ncbi:hypothetical protein [Nocardioides psychrotolerans]|uniref:hypothetical protein n=1 Tax=Nocardioides psychrotolerans TaxID=1005945 RepID=UPI003137D683
MDLVRRTLAVVSSLAVGLTLVAASTATAAARESVDAGSLPTGPRPAVAYLEGRTLHLPSGSNQVLPFPASHAGSLSLLGPSPQGWVVLDRFGGSARLFKVKNGAKTSFWRTGDLSAYSWRLGVNGKRVFQLYTDRSAVSSAVVFDLAGRRVASTSFPGYATLLAFTGDRAVVVGTKTWDWLIGSPKSAISVDRAPAADIRKNILFLPDEAGTGVGPTTLGLPDAPEWVASFQPRAVSPDGSYVVGLSPNGKSVQVRDMVGGFLVRSLTIQHRSGFPLLWESDTAVVLGVKTAQGRALVRCKVTGPCKRATPFSAGARPITVSFQPHYFGD